MIDVLKRIPLVYPISDIVLGKLRLPQPDRQHSGFLENLFLSNAYLARVEQELNRTLLFWLLSQHIRTVHDSHKVAFILSHDHFFNI